MNRVGLGIPKTHGLAAASVEEVEVLSGWNDPTPAVKPAVRSWPRLDNFSLLRGHLTRARRIKGFQTGDIVWAVVPGSAQPGIWVARDAVPATGSLSIQASTGIGKGAGRRSCCVTQRTGGYGSATTAISKKGAASSLCLEAGVSAAKPR